MLNNILFTVTLKGIRLNEPDFTSASTKLFFFFVVFFKSSKNPHPRPIQFIIPCGTEVRGPSFLFCSGHQTLHSVPQ